MLSNYVRGLAATAVFTALPATAQDAKPEAEAPIEKIVVTGSPIAKSRDRFATLVGTADRDELAQAGGLNVADALTDIPGVTSTSFAVGAGRPVIRGFDASRVRVLENGLGSFDVSDLSPDHGVPIDPLSLQRVEIVRGPATLRYGSQAIGGVVNALNDRIPSRIGPRPFFGDVHFAAGSVDGSSEIAALVNGNFGDFAWHLDGVKQDRGNYEIPIAPGVMANTAADGYGYSAGGSVIGSKGYFGGAFVRYDSKYGIPAEDAFIDMKQDKGLFAAEWRDPLPGFTAFRVNAGISAYSHNEVVEGEGIASTFLDDQYEIRSELVTGAFGPFSAAAIGVQLQNREFSGLGEAEDFLFPSVTDAWGLFGFAEAPLGERMTLEFGARYEMTDLEGTPISGILTRREFDAASASAGAVFRATEDLTFGLALAYAERAPNQVELLARGPHEATGTFEIGDPTLGVEKALNIEANARLTMPRVTAELTVFHTSFDGFVFGQLTGNSYNELGVFFPDLSAEFAELLYLQSDATFVGGEFQAAIQVAQFGGGELMLDLMADMVRAEFEGGGNVPRIPPMRVGGGLRYEGPVVDVHAKLMHALDQDEIAANETPTDGYTRLDAGITWHAAKADNGTDVGLSLIGRNLTDEEIRNHVAFNKDEVVMPGRDVRLVLSLRY